MFKPNAKKVPFKQSCALSHKEQTLGKYFPGRVISKRAFIKHGII